MDKETGEIIPSYISIDRQTNEIEAIPVKDVPVTTRIGQTEFTEHEIAELVAGRALPNKEIVLSEKRKFNRHVAGERGTPGRGVRAQTQTERAEQKAAQWAGNRTNGTTTCQTGSDRTSGRRTNCHRDGRRTEAESL